MRLKIFPMIAFALMLGACPIAKADSVIEIHPFGSGTEVETVAISTDLKIDFVDKGFDFVRGEGDLVGSYEYSDVMKIVFIANSSVESITGSSADVIVTPNPVVDMITLRGADEFVGSEINIYSIDGQNKLRISEWNGESIDVSYLPAGIYIINTQSKNLKFVKLCKKYYLL